MRELGYTGRNYESEFEQAATNIFNNNQFRKTIKIYNMAYPNTIFRILNHSKIIRTKHESYSFEIQNSY